MEMVQFRTFSGHQIRGEKENFKEEEKEKEKMFK
jgi:hypothetical protein